MTLRNAAALVLLGAVLLAGCGTTPSPSPTAPAASASPSASPSEAACTNADLTATAGQWGGAAGSRGTSVTVDSRSSSPCLLSPGALVALDDASGGQLLKSEPIPSATAPTLAPAGTASFSLVFSNWCDESVSLPLNFTLELPSGAVPIGNLSLSRLDDLPPCNGPGQPASLSTTAWQQP